MNDIMRFQKEDKGNRKGTDIKYGARPLRRAVQRYLEDELSDMILKKELLDGQTVDIDFKNDKLTFKVK